MQRPEREKMWCKVGQRTNEVDERDEVGKERTRDGEMTN